MEELYNVKFCIGIAGHAIWLHWQRLSSEEEEEEEEYPGTLVAVAAKCSESRLDTPVSCTRYPTVVAKADNPDDKTAPGTILPPALMAVSPGARSASSGASS